ncbi:peptidase [Pusillimonas sp. TS35]|nr:PepSY domain-containing protein [Paracandidimonas lactea]MYN14385.1 peptidase [Pusillimonas sp. TS35]
MAAGTASADHGGSHDHEAAREAVLQGRVLPLRAVLDKVEREYPGQVVKIEFEEDDDLYVYKIKVLRSTGDIVKLKVDATDGRVLAVRARETLSGDD